MKEKLSEDGKQYMECIFCNTIEDTQRNHFPESTKRELIMALNNAGRESDFVDEVDAFLAGVRYQKRRQAYFRASLKKKLNNL